MSPTQPYPSGDAFVAQSIDIAPEGHRLVNQGRIFTPFWTTGVALKPAAFGGANWPPSSYDPETQLLFICGNDRIGLFTGTDIDEEIPADGEIYLGGTFGGVPIPSTGILAALDMTTNRLVWRQRLGDLCYSGSIVTAGGLLFVGRNDGRFTALDSSDGSRLWEFQTGAGVNATASMFEYAGTEYVVVYSGGSLFARAPRGDSVWLFSLDGGLEVAAPPATPRRCRRRRLGRPMRRPANRSTGRPASSATGRRGRGATAVFRFGASTLRPWSASCEPAASRCPRWVAASRQMRSWT